MHSDFNNMYKYYDYCILPDMGHYVSKGLLVKEIIVHSALALYPAGKLTDILISLDSFESSLNEGSE